MTAVEGKLLDMDPAKLKMISDALDAAPCLSEYVYDVDRDVVIHLHTGEVIPNE